MNNNNTYYNTGFVDGYNLGWLEATKKAKEEQKKKQADAYKKWADKKLKEDPDYFAGRFNEYASKQVSIDPDWRLKYNEAQRLKRRDKKINDLRAAAREKLSNIKPTLPTPLLEENCLNGDNQRNS